MSKFVRQSHRWLVIVFVLAVIATTIAMSQKEPIIWVSYVPLAPLALLFISGIYLYALPHAARWRSARRARST